MADLRQRAVEILALTKMNWNSSEGIGRYPITLSFAKKVGMLMAELPDDQIPNPYRACAIAVGVTVISSGIALDR